MESKLFSRRAFILSGALLAVACSGPSDVKPIDGQTFIIEGQSRRAIWDASVETLNANGEVSQADYDLGEVRGYYGRDVLNVYVLISMNQLYPGEDVYSISVATLSDVFDQQSNAAREALVRDIRRGLGVES